MQFVIPYGTVLLILTDVNAMKIWKRFPLTTLLATILAALLFFPADAIANGDNPQKLIGEYVSVNQSTFDQQTTLCIDTVNSMANSDNACQLREKQCRFSGTLQTTSDGQNMIVDGKLYSFNIPELIAITFQTYRPDFKYPDVYEAWAGLTDDQYETLDLMGSRVEIDQGEVGSISPIAAIFMKTPETGDSRFNCNS
ncbi:MAG: hypothetical protein F6K18_29045 [Okeania sp. SIO2C2]|uniref:hypothetical protein n=1 Tax=Okeania sp. SIO2C2 TaxID=2607787 RepID=UPI0013BC31BF|nr:hypothetical protein [Okeania sp. SIO2C2]NEP90537.1 hypothetical protein [Okeania sp. SIO2C2]